MTKSKSEVIFDQLSIKTDKQLREMLHEASTFDQKRVTNLGVTVGEISNYIERELEFREKYISKDGEKIPYLTNISPAEHPAVARIEAMRDLYLEIYSYNEELLKFVHGILSVYPPEDIYKNGVTIHKVLEIINPRLAFFRRMNQENSRHNVPFSKIRGD
jgi:hypothetical protein